jgi:hypothetical protein
MMKCVTTVRYQIKVNGNFTEQFTPSRGLRQGDPLSPYLFVICAEGLSALLQEAEANGKITGIRICPAAPPVTHLFFADDSVLLIKANGAEARALRDILDLYENCSGQCINAEKSAIMFSKNSRQFQIMAVKEALAIQGDAWNERYLGLPVYIGRSKKKAFQYLKDKIWARIQGWIEKLLSKAGKEVLIKAVA